MNLAILFRNTLSTAGHEELDVVCAVSPLAGGARSGLNSDPRYLTLPVSMGPPEAPSKAEILREIQHMMSELFELASDRVQPEARLVEDLELDSLDAFDLAVKVEETTGVALDEDKLRTLRTVEDVIVALEGILRTKGWPALRSAAHAQTTPQTDP